MLQIENGHGAEVDESLKEICLEISKRYEIIFLEIGTDKNHVHFLVQSVPKYSPTKIIQTIKSITAREIFTRHPEVKKIMGWRILVRRIFCKHSK
ncbi:IS200/IS605 family transposase [Paenibacillus tritici]|nr:IS200/IS605 family transposase [Paenibacillus tritici]